MTPAEVAAKLRQFNEWRRGDYEPSEQPEPPNPYEVGLAIDAAVEMIDRLEAAERERNAAELMSLALQAKVETMERQRPEPAARIVGEIGEWVSNGEGTYSLGGRLDAFVPLRNGTLLYALPAAQGDEK